LTRNINSAGGQYEYQKKELEWEVLVFKVSDESILSNLKAVNYEFNEEYLFGYQNLNKLPNDNYNLYQSSYVNYNWSNNFKNEK
jgi:hypothetical protein